MTLAQPLVSVIVPAFTLLVKVITAVVSQITRLVALISGKSVKATANSAKALNKETSALKGTGSAAKKAASQLAAFDEINQISTNTANDAGGGASADAITPDFSYMDDISDRLKNRRCSHAHCGRLSAVENQQQLAGGAWHYSAKARWNPHCCWRIDSSVGRTIRRMEQRRQLEESA